MFAEGRITNLSSLDQFIDEMDRMVAVVGLTHHLSNSVRTDSIIWTTNTRDTEGLSMLRDEILINFQVL